MRYLFSIVVAGLLFCTGCSDKSGLFTPDLMEEKALTLTKKGEIYNSLEIKAALIATYLNPLLKRYRDADRAHFLISLHIDNDFTDPKKAGLNNPDYTLTLNGAAPLAIKPLKEDDPLMKIAPVKTLWAHHYLVTFPKHEDKALKMVLKSVRYGSSLLTFRAE